MVIVDNTNGKDTGLKELEYLASDINIIKNNGEGLQRSISHASALDKGLRYVDTKYCLIIDPDTYIFKSDWDTFCLSNLIEKNVVIGAPYPEWKIGKVHDFPSVIFLCFLELMKSRISGKIFTHFHLFIDLCTTLFLER